MDDDVSIERFTAAVAPVDAAAAEAVAARHDRLTKPPGSLGRLEELAARIAAIQRSSEPSSARKAIVVAVADHGVVAEGVSPYPQTVTAQMVANFLRGGAAISVLAKQAGARLLVADFGIAAAPSGNGEVEDCRIAGGTANMAAGPAMTREQALAAIAHGEALAGRLARDGLDLLALGEMGIGNTTSASALTATLTGAPVADVTGRGTGLDEAGIAHKIAVIERALRVNAPDPSAPVDVLAKVGGFEVAGLVGLMLGAAAQRVPVVLDGFITGAAALVATRIQPRLSDYLIASHRSQEPGHAAVLNALSLDPLFDLRMRLGEGTGAAIALQLIDDAVALLHGMATFDEAHVDGRGEA